MAPLKGIKVIEFAGLAPGPFCGMILADLGAKVIRMDSKHQISVDMLSRGKMSLAVDMKKSKGVEIARKLCKTTDVLIDPYRPGVLEKLGVGPKEIMKDNSRIIYARLTGYGQYGPMSKKAGHDINFLAMSGILSYLRPNQESQPQVPLNLVADFGGGGAMCALGILAALFQRASTGKGQVIDASMVEGAAYLGSFVNYMKNTPIISEGWLGGASHFYTTYKTKDGKYVAVGGIEDKFYEAFLNAIGLDISQCPQLPPSMEIKNKIARKIFEKTRDEWTSVFDEVDACVTPVLTTEEAANHPHNVARNSFHKLDPSNDSHTPDSSTVDWTDCSFIPCPAPRLSDVRHCRERLNLHPTPVGRDTVEILKSLGYDGVDIKQLIDEDVVEDTGPQSKL